MNKPEDATLLDILVDAFEKNEVLAGFHNRDLPLPTEEKAVSKFEALSNEARRWMGDPVIYDEQAQRRLAAWSDLEIRQAGRGVLVRVRAPDFRWWNESTIWEGNPMKHVYDWLSEEYEEDRMAGKQD